MGGAQDAQAAGAEKMSQSPNPFGVELATPSDEAEIFAVLQRLHTENGMWPMNAEKVRGEISNATRRNPGQPSVIGLLRDRPDSAIEGMVWLMLTDGWYTDWVHWNERLLYVIPECRRSTHSKRLAGFAKWISDVMTEQWQRAQRGKVQAPDAQPEVPLIIGIMTDHNLEAKMRLYQRQFSQIGAIFMHRLVPRTSYNQKRVIPMDAAEARRVA